MPNRGFHGGDAGDVLTKTGPVDSAFGWRPAQGKTSATVTLTEDNQIIHPDLSLDELIIDVGAHESDLVFDQTPVPAHVCRMFSTADLESILARLDALEGA